MKICRRCKISKPSTDFYKASRNSDGLQSYCKKCSQSATKKRPDRYRNVQVDKNAALKRTYGISLERYKELLEKQRGVCAICGTSSPGTRNGKELYFSVDHDHTCCPGKKSCGKCVRGLLCQNCNFAIGLLKDSVTTLQSAISYIQEFS